MDYSPEVLRRFASPAKAGEIGPGEPGVVEAEAEDRSLNVWVRFQVQVQGDVVRDARFQAYGCPHMIAAASWAAEWLCGRPAEALQALPVDSMRRALEVPTEKLGKLLCIEDAVSACGNRLRERGGGT